MGYQGHRRCSLKCLRTRLTTALECSTKIIRTTNIQLKSPLELNMEAKILESHQRKPKPAKHPLPSSINWRMSTRKLSQLLPFTSRVTITVQMIINTQPSITIPRKIQQTSTIATRLGRICKPKTTRIKISIQHTIRNILVTSWTTAINTSQTQPRKTLITIISLLILDRKSVIKTITKSAQKLLRLSSNQIIMDLLTTLQPISILLRRNIRSIVVTS